MRLLNLILWFKFQLNNLQSMLFISKYNMILKLASYSLPEVEILEIELIKSYISK